jgi:2'-5' RNA ligase
MTGGAPRRPAPPRGPAPRGTSPPGPGLRDTSPPGRARRGDSPPGRAPRATSPPGPAAPSGPAPHGPPPPRRSQRGVSPAGPVARRTSPSRASGERPLRLFVALDLPDAARDALAALGAAADAAVWRAVKPESLHVTLAFLGWRPPSDVDAIEPVIAAEDGGPAPRLALRPVLLLPPRRARVLTVELQEDGLRALQARVSSGLEAVGVYTPEERPFRPHVTVARLRPRTRSPRDTGLRVDPLEFSARAVTLYVSRPHPSGTHYEPLAGASLR